MRRYRAAEADSLLDGVAARDGRAIPGQGADAYTATTQHHPSRRFARRDEPEEVVDYVTRADTRTPADAGIPMGQRVLPASQLQRYRPVAEDRRRPAVSQPTTTRKLTTACPSAT